MTREEQQWETDGGANYDATRVFWMTAEERNGYNVSPSEASLDCQSNQYDISSQMCERRAK